VGQSIYEGRSVMAMTKEEKKAYFRAYYLANKDKINAKNKQWYVDNKEKVQEHGIAWRENNKERLKEYRKINKDRLAETQKRWREDNKERLSAASKAYYAANRDRCLAYNKRWILANKEHLKEYSKKYAESGKRREYQKKNKHIFQNNSAKYRALKRKQVPVHLRDCLHEKKRLLEIYKLRTILSEATGVQHHVDHMWPLADGGPHWSGNLQVIPAEENLSKNASVCEETRATIIKSLYTFESERSI
jgi:hypothetical protein